MHKVPLPDHVRARISKIVSGDPDVHAADDILTTSFGEKYRGDEEIVAGLMRKHSRESIAPFENASERLRNDPEFVLKNARRSGWFVCRSGHPGDHMTEQHLLSVAGDKVRKDKRVVLEAVRNSWHALKHAAHEMQNDKEVVLAAVSYYGLALEYAAPQLQSDKEVVLAAVRRVPNALKYAAIELRGDKEVVLAALTTKNSCMFQFALQYASDIMKDTEEIVLAAVNGETITGTWSDVRHASERLRSDPDFMRHVIVKRPEYIAYAADVLKNDYAFLSDVINRVKANKIAVQSKVLDLFVFLPTEVVEKLGREKNLPEQCRCPTELKERAISLAYEYPPELFPEPLRSMDQIVFRHFCHHARLEHAPSILRENRKCVSGILHPYALKFAADALREDEEFLEKHIRNLKNDVSPVQFASERLRGKKEFMMPKLRYSFSVYEYATPDLRRDEDFLKEAKCKFVTQYENSTVPNRTLELANCFPPEFRTDKDFMWKIVDVDGMALRYADTTLRGNIEVVLKAVANTGHALQYASTELRGNIKVLRQACAPDSKKRPEHQSVHNFKTSEFDRDRADIAPALVYASEEIYADKNFFQEFLRERKWWEAGRKDWNYWLPFFSPDVFLGDPEVARMIAADHSITHPGSLPAPLRDNPTFRIEFMKARILTHSEKTVIDYIPYGLRGDYSFMKEVIGLFSNKDVLRDIKNFIQKDPALFRHASESMRGSREICDWAFYSAQKCKPADDSQTTDNQKSVLHFASSELRRDREFIKSLLKDHPSAVAEILENADPVLRLDPEIIQTAMSHQGTSAVWRTDGDFICRALQVAKDHKSNAIAKEVFKYANLWERDENLKDKIRRKMNELREEDAQETGCCGFMKSKLWPRDSWEVDRFTKPDLNNFWEKISESQRDAAEFGPEPTKPCLQKIQEVFCCQKESSSKSDSEHESQPDADESSSESDSEHESSAWHKRIFCCAPSHSKEAV